MTDMIFPAEEHREHTNGLPLVVDVEPVDRPSDSKMSQTGQQVVMVLAAVGRGQDALRGGADLANPCLGPMVEYQPEVAFGIDRELKTERHGRGACRQPLRRAARP